MNLLHIDDNSLPFDVPEFENKLFLSYENEWLRKINQLPKLQLYKSIKTREKLSMCLDKLGSLSCQQNTYL